MLGTDNIAIIEVCHRTWKCSIFDTKVKKNPEDGS